MKWLPILLALLCVAAAPVEAVTLGTYRETTRTRFGGHRFVCSKWQLYTTRGWRPTWIEDRARQVRTCFFISSKVTYSTAIPEEWVRNEGEEL
jgi:hypothetical protein